jgi:hypothetical protein
MAVIAALCPISVLAQEFTQEQIDAIVAKAVDKALAERQAKWMPPSRKSGRGDRAAKRGAIPGYGDSVRD